MSDQIQFAPFREAKDFFGQAENYSIPDLRDLARLSNRITNNLLYYQTNYMLFFGLLFVLISIIHPTQVLTGLFVFIALAAALIFLTNKSVEIQRLKRDKPYLNLVIIIGVTGFLFNMFGSILLFLYSICLPLSLIFIHAALRQRNLMNKLTNKKEQLIGISRTPMGFLLQQLGATNEIAS